jgi:putative holliday junction resolvase
MGRIIAIDYGKKRVGIAVTDPLKIISNGLTTLSPAEVIPFLTKYMAEQSVETVVVGLAKQMNNEASESMRYIVPFVKQLQKQFPALNVEMFDERFTSKLALKAMLEGGVKKKDRQNKALMDEISATILLQSYMEFKNNNMF